MQDNEGRQSSNVTCIFAFLKFPAENVGLKIIYLPKFIALVFLRICVVVLEIYSSSATLSDLSAHIGKKV